MYNVVFRNISGSESHGVITWTSYENEADFKESQESPNMQKWYEVIKKDVTTEEAVRICSSPSAQMVHMSSMFRSIEQRLSDIRDAFQDELDSLKDEEDFKEEI